LGSGWLYHYTFFARIKGHAWAGLGALMDEWDASLERKKDIIVKMRERSLASFLSLLSFLRLILHVLAFYLCFDIPVSSTFLLQYIISYFVLRYTFSCHLFKRSFCFLSFALLLCELWAFE
jgi:hypothetical protein